MEYITLPLTVGFDQNRVIGSITLDKDSLPKQVDYHFACSYKAGENGNEELLEVALVPNSNFAGRRKGKKRDRGNKA